jgi:predicted phosphodiesterase
MSINKSSKNLRILRSLLTSPLLCLTAALVVALAAVGGCAKATKAPVQPPASEEQAVADFVELTKGPLLLRVSQNRAALMWEADAEGFGKLSYGVGEQLEKHISVEPERVEYRIRSKGGARQKKTAFIYKTWLKNLRPGQVYDYRITGPQTQSSVYSFRTVPADTDEVTFAVYGDCRTYPSRHRKIVEQIIKKKVDFVVISGDLVTNGGIYPQWKQQFFQPLKGLAESVPIYTVKGNHDLSRQNYFEKLLVPSGQTANFSFDYGPVHYFCADNYVKTEAQILSLIAADISASTSTWKFVSYHEPTINFGGHWSDWAYPDALSAFAKAGADFVITGHSHQYERFRPIAPPPGMDGSYVTYITSAGGGAPMYDVESTNLHAKAKQIHHFCLFHIKGNKLTMDTIDINGRIVDQLEINKIDGRLNKGYLQTAVSLEEVQLFRDAHSEQ